MTTVTTADLPALNFDSQNADTIGDLLLDVLTTTINMYDLGGIAVPPLQYVTVGQVVHDCEEVVVSFVQMYLGSPGTEAQTPTHCEGPRSIVMSIEVVRCIPTGDPRVGGPSADEFATATLIQARDAWMLMDIASAISVKYLNLGVLSDVTSTPASGGMQAMSLNLVMQVL